MANDVEIKIKLDTASAQKSIKQLNDVLNMLANNLDTAKFDALNAGLKSLSTTLNTAGKRAQTFASNLNATQIENYVNALIDASAAMQTLSNVNTQGVSNLNTQLNNTQRSARTTRQEVTQTTSAFSNMAQGIMATYAALGVIQSGFNQFQQVLAATVGKAIKFEYELAKIQTVISDNTKAASDLAPQINRLTQEFGQDRSDVAKTYFDVIASGAVEASKATYIVTEAQRLATASFTDSATAGTALLSTLTAYNMDATQASKVSDVLFSAMKDGRIRMADFANGMGQVSPMAALLGVKLEELSGGISALSLTTDPSESLTLFRNVLVKLLNPTEAMKTRFKELGITAIDATIRTDGLQKTLKRLITDTNGAAFSTMKLSEMFSDQQAIAGAASLSTEKVGKAWESSTQHAIDSFGGVTDGISKVSNTAQFKMNQLRGFFEVEFSAMGESWVSVFSQNNDVVINFFNTVKAVVKTLGALVAGIATLMGSQVALVFQVVGDAVTAVIQAVQYAVVFIAKKFVSLGAVVADALGGLGIDSVDKAAKQLQGTLDKLEPKFVGFSGTVEVASSAFGLLKAAGEDTLDNFLNIGKAANDLAVGTTRSTAALTKQTVATKEAILASEEANKKAAETAKNQAAKEAADKKEAERLAELKKKSEEYRKELDKMAEKLKELSGFSKNLDMAFKLIQTDAELARISDVLGAEKTATVQAEVMRLKSVGKIREAQLTYDSLVQEAKVSQIKEAQKEQAAADKEALDTALKNAAAFNKAMSDYNVDVLVYGKDAYTKDIANLNKFFDTEEAKNIIAQREKIKLNEGAAQAELYEMTQVQAQKIKLVKDLAKEQSLAQEERIQKQIDDFNAKNAQEITLGYNYGDVKKIFGEAFADGALLAKETLIPAFETAFSMGSKIFEESFQALKSILEGTFEILTGSFVTAITGVQKGLDASIANFTSIIDGQQKIADDAIAKQEALAQTTQEALAKAEDEKQKNIAALNESYASDIKKLQDDAAKAAQDTAEKKAELDKDHQKALAKINEDAAIAIAKANQTPDTAAERISEIKQELIRDLRDQNLSYTDAVSKINTDAQKAAKEIAEKNSSTQTDLQKNLEKINKENTGAISDANKKAAAETAKLQKEQADALDKINNGTANELKRLPNALAAVAKGAFAETLLKNIVTFSDSFGAIADSFASLLNKMVPQIVQAIPQLAQNFVLAFPKITAAILAAIPPLTQALIAVAPQVFAAIIQQVPAFVQAILAQMPMFINLITQMMVQVISMLPQLMQVLAANFGPIVTALITAIPPIVNALAANAAPIVLALINGIVPQLPMIVTALISSFALMMPNLALTFSVSLIKSLPDIAKAFVNIFITYLPNMIKSIADGIGKAVSDAVKGVANAATGGASGVLGKVGDAVGNVVSGVTKVVKKIWPFAEGGIVQGNAAVAGNSYLNDTVPAMLSAGEMVIPRSAMQGGFNDVMKFVAANLKGGTQNFADGGIVQASGGGSQTIILQVDGMTLAKVVRNQVQNGFRLQ